MKLLRESPTYNIIHSNTMNDIQYLYQIVTIFIIILVTAMPVIFKIAEPKTTWFQACNISAACVIFTLISTSIFVGALALISMFS